MADADARFDLVMFDTAPTGHTIRLLSLPEVMAAWTDGLLKHQDRSRRLGAVLKGLGGGRAKGDDLSLIDSAEDYPEDSTTAKIHQILLTRRRKFVRARELLLDTNTTSFLLVLNPDKLSILESKKALDLLERFKVPVTAIVVNRILPREADGQFLQARRLQEEKYREEIDRKFGAFQRVFPTAAVTRCARYRHVAADWPPAGELRRVSEPRRTEPEVLGRRLDDGPVEQVRRSRAVWESYWPTRLTCPTCPHGNRESVLGSS